MSVQPQSTWPRDDNQQDPLSLDDISQVKESPLAGQDSQEEGEDGVAEGTNKFYCYLCSITCHNQQVGWIKHTAVLEEKSSTFILLFSPLVFLSPELQESYEQYFSPAEDDGDPAHEQRMSGHPAASSARVSSGNKQRGVRSHYFPV